MDSQVQVTLQIQNQGHFRYPLRAKKAAICYKMEPI